MMHLTAKFYATVLVAIVCIVAVTVVRRLLDVRSARRECARRERARG